MNKLDSRNADGRERRRSPKLIVWSEESIFLYPDFIGNNKTYCEIIALWSESLFSLYSLDFSFGSYSWLWCIFPCFVQLQRNMEIRSKCWRTTIQKIDFQKGSVVIRCLPPNVYIIFSDDIYLARFCTVLELLHKILSPVCIRTTAYIRLLQIRNLALGLSKK